MKNQELVKIAKNYMKIWNAKNSISFRKYSSEKLTVYYSHFEKKLNRENFFESLKITHKMFPDLKMKTKSIDIADKKVIINWSYTATFTTGKMFGVKAKHQKININGITFLEISDDKVVKETGIVDNLTLAFQLGAIKAE
ncbi:ester cyclase [Elizabethkingia anophelis]|uniref:ester cyclase n=1 Tax=Elizabethkingia anophelis TaxID=1117645 RepID=UPI00084035E7|nr:ester cyclase [Elizabethkingia anophelis]OCW71884.1 hypothetical protein A4G24_17660 [Elizabethkingia anophelis]